MTISKSIVETLSAVMKEDHFKKGDKVTVSNAKSYDSACKSDTASGTIVGSMGKGDKEVYMVKVGSGQMNVSPKDLKLEESKCDHVFQVGDKIVHKEFGEVEVTNVHDDNKMYNTVCGVSGIDIKSKGNTYTLWFDTETLRKQKRVGDQLKNIITVNGKPLI